MSTKVLLIFLFFSYFLIQNFLFFLFCQSQVSYFPIFFEQLCRWTPCETVCCSKSSGRCWASVVLVRRLTEWWRFHFWYQPRDALNSGSLLNSFAFRRSINPVTAIPVQNEVRRLPNDQKDKNLTCLEFVLTLWKLANENLSYTMLSHDTTIVLRVTHSTHIHSAISWLIYFVILFLLF